VTAQEDEPTPHRGSILEACTTCGCERYWHQHFSDATHCGACVHCNVFRGERWWLRLANRVLWWAR
jgi:hypothetical protein